MGFEPTTFELEVQRAIRCATAAMRYRETQILRNAYPNFHQNFTFLVKQEKLQANWQQTSPVLYCFYDD